MKTGDHRWDTKTELRTRCKLSLRLHTGHVLFTAGASPLAAATLMPDGKTLDIVIRVDRILPLMPNAQTDGAKRLSARRSPTVKNLGLLAQLRNEIK